tara:strand:- start:595 stop:1221 length:627 start_codon:yes stop_codon:yes gene_type:complete
MRDNEFDLAIVDPPYGIGASTKSFMRTGTQTGKSKAISGLYKSSNWDNSSPKKEYFLELQRVSKNQIIFGANHFIESIPNCNSSCWVVWNKNNGDNKYSDCELAYTSFKSGVRMIKYTWHGMIQQNMKNKEIRIHPTQKPVALYLWLLQKYAQSGDKILDTHLGSGSSALAAHDLGFDFVGYELDTEYFDKAQERLRQHQRQLSLFGA